LILGVYSRRLRTQDLLTPLLGDLFSQIGAHLRDRWELVSPFPRTGRVDDEAGVEALLTDGDDRVQRPAPRALDQVEVLLRLRARAHRPDDVVQVRDVDVLVNDDD